MKRMINSSESIQASKYKPSNKVPEGWELSPDNMEEDDEFQWTISKPMHNDGGYYWIDRNTDDDEHYYYTVSYAYREPSGRVGKIWDHDEKFRTLNYAIIWVDNHEAYDEYIDDQNARGY